MLKNNQPKIIGYQLDSCFPRNNSSEWQENWIIKNGYCSKSSVSFLETVVKTRSPT